jgi:hypothetical protein
LGQPVEFSIPNECRHEPVGEVLRFALARSAVIAANRTASTRSPSPARRWARASSGCHLHDLRPEQAFRKRALSKKCDELRHLGELSQSTDALEAEIADLVAQAAPQPLAEPGVGP